MTTAVTKENVEMATQQNSRKTPGFAYFSDTIRDALKGSVFDRGAGFVSGDYNKGASVGICFLGKPIWCKSPAQSVNYASCHDNNTLIDRIALSRVDASREDLIKMNNLAAAIYMTSQGIPFMQAGEEMLRTKVNDDGSFNENSYNASDAVNSLKWSTLDEKEYSDVFEYYKGLIAFRKAHPALRQSDADSVRDTVTQVNGLPKGVLAFEIAAGANGDSAEGMYLIFNASEEAQSISLPEGSWNVYINGEKAGTDAIENVSGTATVDPISALVLIRGEAGEVKADSAGSTHGIGTAAAICAAAVVVCAAVVAAVVIKKRGKKS